MQGGVTVGVGVQWCTKSCRKVQCFVEEHRGAWRSVVVCWSALWSRRSVSHRIEYTRGVTGTVTHVGHEIVHDGIAVARGTQCCRGTGRNVQWHAKEYGDT